MSNATYMKKALDLASYGMHHNHGGPFGAVVVVNQKIVGKGYNQVTSKNDPTAHAEIVAIRSACKKLKTFCLDTAALFTSCEPCPMCLAAIYWARIPTVFYAYTQHDAKKIGFDDTWIYEEVALPVDQRKIVMKQLLRDEALEPFKEWAEKQDKISY